MRRALIAALMFAAAGTARADFNEGQARFLHDDFAGARIAWEAAAAQGDARAQYSLGVLHWRGFGVAADHAKAARWFAQAARQGYGPARSALAGLAAEAEGGNGLRRSGHAI